MNNPIATPLYNILIYTVGLKRSSKIFRKCWGKLWNIGCSLFKDRKVTTFIHGRKALMNFGYIYPVICREFPTYNSPLIELTYQTFITKGSPISVVDVGAAVGDTIMLIDASCPNMVNKFYCVDGDEEFFSYLVSNLGGRKDVVLIKALLSSTNGKIRELIKIHPGTASSQGSKEMFATTINQLSDDDVIGGFDLLKIDVDGFDGQVIKGAMDSLKKYKPTIIFEWHPILCNDTGNNWLDHFLTLFQCGYERFVWFDNYGNFSFFMNKVDVQSINSLASICINRKHEHADYFDVIALHNDCSIDDCKLAELNYSRKNKHSY